MRKFLATPFYVLGNVLAYSGSTLIVFSLVLAGIDPADHIRERLEK